MSSGWWNKDEVYMNLSRTISDAKSWLTNACYSHVVWSPAGVIWMDLVMSNHYRHHLRRHLIKLHYRLDHVRLKSSVSNVALESWYFGRNLKCCSEPLTGPSAQSGVIWVDLVMSNHYIHRYEDIR